MAELASPHPAAAPARARSRKPLAELLLVAAPKAAGGALMLLLNLALVRVLDPGEFGAYTLCITTVVLLDAIIGSSVDMGVLRLAPVDRLSDRSAARGVELAGLLLKLAVVVASLPLLWWLAPVFAEKVLHRPGATQLVWLTGLATAGLLVLRSTLAHLQVERDFRAYGALEWLHLAVKFGGCALLLLALQPHADTLMLAIALGPLVAVAAGSVRVAGHWRTALPMWRGRLPQLLGFVKWYVPTIVVGTLMSKMDVYVLSARAGIDEVGLFAAAAAVAMIPELFGTYFAVVVAPRIMPAVQQGRFLAMYRRIQGGLLMVAVGCMAVAWFALPPLLEMFFPPHFAAAAPVALVLLLGAFGGMLAYPVLVPYLLFQRPSFMLTLDGVLLLPTLAAFVWAVGEHGAMGAAWVTAATRILRTVIAHRFAVRSVKEAVPPPPGGPQGPQRGRLARLMRPYTLWNQVWNIDCHLRYAAARTALHDIPPQQLVEVGAGSAGIGFLLKKPVVGLDIWVNAEVLRQSNPYVIPVVATGLQLPLRDNAVQGALSIDSVEHVPVAERATAIRELLRVATKRVVVSVPCGADADDADRRLIAWHEARHGRRAFWLSEHRELGLPTDAGMHQMIDEAARALGKTVRTRSLDHMSVLVHDTNHRVLMLANYRFARLLSLGLWLAYPLLSLLSGKARYRRFFIVDILE